MYLKQEICFVLNYFSFWRIILQMNNVKISWSVVWMGAWIDELAPMISSLRVT
jgi:hypothetical protein